MSSYYSNGKTSIYLKKVPTSSQTARMHYNKYMDTKHTARLAAFAILERDGKILLGRRFNTGYADGQYQMPSGHIEGGEYPADAAIREAKEEVGVDISLDDLEYVHTSYRITKDDKDYIDFFFKTSKWVGEPINKEPHRCDELIWAPIDDLPQNIVPIVKKVLGLIKEGVQFSQIGKE